jgi:prepilin-type N-terminal cleavage/methylation domain-containing protein
MVRARSDTTSASRAPSPAPRRGYTVVELLIVMAMIGIIAGLALPKYDALPSKADGGMRLVRGALQQAQRMAIQHQHDMIVSFDLAQHRIRIGEDSTDDGIVDAAERERWMSLEEGVQLVTPPSAVPGSQAGPGVAGPGVRSIEGFPSVVFRRNGAASGDIAVYVGVSRGSRFEHRAITVLKSTGRTDWYRYQDTQWKQGDL